MQAMTRIRQLLAFTLIELLAVILLLSVLSIIIIPKFIDFSRSAKIGTLQGIVGAMKSAASMVRLKAITSGLTPASSNPGNQSTLIVDFGNDSSEVDWRNLCPESIAELGDQLTMIDFINLQTSSGLTSLLNNQYTLVGYDIPGFSVPTNQGCYVIYDSFGSPACTVTLVTEDC